MVYTPPKHKHHNKPERFWFDNIKGMTVKDDTIEAVAKAVGGTVEGSLITVQGGHGEFVIRKGDFVGVDQVGTWHIVRLTELTNADELQTLGKPKKNHQVPRGA